jgi:glutamate synthase (NADPH/NADH) small chain
MATTFSQSQRDLLMLQIEQNPQRFQQMIIDESQQAIRQTLKMGKLNVAFTNKLWELLLIDNELSTALHRYLWRIPLKQKRAFIQALDEHLSSRYPMFKGLSVGWPGKNNIPPYVRPAQERRKDFDLVNQGYLGYMGLGYSLREVELFVWLEVLRDKQCEDSPCEVGIEQCTGESDEQGEPNTEQFGGCPVKIHIPQALNLMGEGNFKGAFKLICDANPLPNVTGRVCPQEMQCQGVCTLNERPIEIGQLEWFLPQRQRLLDAVNAGKGNKSDIVDSDDITTDVVVCNPWMVATKPPIAIVGSGPSGLINAFLLASAGYPVTVFEAFHALGGVLRYGIPEFRLPNQLIDDVVTKIKLLGGRFVTNYIVGKTATLADLKGAGFSRIFVGTGAGLPRFMNIPGEHLLNIMSANEFLTRVNLMHANETEYETPLPEIKGKQVMIIGGGNTAMDAARTACRLGGKVTIVYRRSMQEMPARVEELHHALEEGIELKELRAPCEFFGDKNHIVASSKLKVMTLGEPDASGRCRPQATGETELMKVDLAIMALGNNPNPIVKDSEPDLETSKWGTVQLNQGSQQTSLNGIYSGGDATRGGSTAIKAAGDGQAAAKEIIKGLNFNDSFNDKQIKKLVAKASHYTDLGQTEAEIVKRNQLTTGIVEFTIKAPLIAKSVKAGQFVRVLIDQKGELIPLTIADWNTDDGTIVLVIQGLGSSSKIINQMQKGDCFTAIAGPLGKASKVVKHQENERVIFTAGGVGLPAVFPIMRAQLKAGNRVTLIAGFRGLDFCFWTEPGGRIETMRDKYPKLLDVIYASNDGSFGIKGFVTMPLEEILINNRDQVEESIAEVITIGPPLMMRAISDLTLSYKVPCVASLNSIMVDATGMCGACMVPVIENGILIRKHACIDGPEINSHIIDWDKFLPRFSQFKPQEYQSQIEHHLIDE